jgi:hypothetical protein
MSAPASRDDRAHWRSEVVIARLSASALRRAGRGLVADLERAAARFGALDAAAAPADADPLAVLATLLRAQPSATATPTAARRTRITPQSPEQKRALRLVPAPEGAGGRVGAGGAVSRMSPPQGTARIAPGASGEARRIAEASAPRTSRDAAASLAERRAAMRAGRWAEAALSPVVRSEPRTGGHSAAEPTVAGAPLAATALTPPAGTTSAAGTATADAVTGATLFAAAVARLTASMPAAAGSAPADAPPSAPSAAGAQPLDRPEPSRVSAARGGIHPGRSAGASLAGVGEAGPVFVPALPASAVTAIAPGAPGSSGTRLRLAEEDPLIRLAHHHGIDPSWP